MNTTKSASTQQFNESTLGLHTKRSTNSNFDGDEGNLKQTNMSGKMNTAKSTPIHQFNELTFGLHTKRSSNSDFDGDEGNLKHTMRMPIGYYYF